MLAGKFHLLKITGLLATAAGSLFAAEFAAPAEGPVAFRRDRVPLDSDTMAEISRGLVTLAYGFEAESPEEFRGLAQMLALSLALDPGNGSARTLIDTLAGHEHQIQGDSEKIAAARSKMWKWIDWLETPEAGPQGQALAACLQDVLAISDPEDSAVASRAPDRGAWDGWIPPLSAYGKKDAPGDEEPGNAPDSPPGSGPALAAASVTTLFSKKGNDPENPKWKVEPASLEMTAKWLADQPFSLVIGSDPTAFPELRQVIVKALEKQHATLPAGVQVTVSSAALEPGMPPERAESLGAAIAVLASSAITGREPDAVVIGTFDAAGNLGLPGDLWEKLQALPNEGGRRLVLPAVAAEILPSMLALERPRFFIDHEVLLASDFAQLLDLTEKSPSPALEGIINRFREVRGKATPQTLGQYVSNSFVRRRLAELAQEAPFHCSARMLAILGTGNRPVTVPRTVLVSEIRRALEPMEWILRIRPYAKDPEDLERIGASYEASRSGVDQLVRYAGKEDRELLGRVQDMIAAIRTYDRARRAKPSPYDTTSVPNAAHMQLVRLYGGVSKDLGMPTVPLSR